ncbi:MAG: TspO/MBR family protein [Nanoarchaeota archaeon]
MKKRFNVKAFVLALLASFGAGALGSAFTMKVVKSEWYSSLKPGITPADYVFPIVWNILFFLIALSIYFAWTSSANKKERKSVAVVFAVNLVLNAFWSLLFFALQNPFLAFIDIIFMIISTIFAVRVCCKINRLSAYLIIPYLVWISFASILNYQFMINWFG